MNTTKHVLLYTSVHAPTNDYEQLCLLAGNASYPAEHQ
jgi:hypothetical protein